MVRSFRSLAVLVAVSALFLACARVGAQTVIVMSPPAVRCYTPPVVSYYAPPAVSYYAPRAVSYYAPPAVSYYAPPVVSYYAPPAVSYYAPAVVASPVTTVTTYRYGLLPRRRYTTVQTYTPATTYYTPVYAGP